MLRFCPCSKFRHQNRSTVQHYHWKEADIVITEEGHVLKWHSVALVLLWRTTWKNRRTSYKPVSPVQVYTELPCYGTQILRIMCKGCEVYDFSSFAHFGHKKWSKKSLLKNIKSVGCKGFQVLSSSTLTCDSGNDRLCLLQEFMASSDRILSSSFRF